MQFGIATATAMVVAAAALTAGCSTSSSTCWRIKLDVSPNKVGASTAPAAIDALVGQDAIKGLPSSGWVATPSGDSYKSAAFTLTVNTVPGHDGFFVTKVSTCDN
jgi:hypothetical protein